MLSLLAATLLAAPTVVGVPVGQASPLKLAGRVAVAQLGPTPTLLWVDSGLSAAAGSRFVVPGSRWAGRSLWLGDLSVAGSPTLLSARLLCPAFEFANISSPRIAATAGADAALVVFIAVDGDAKQQVRALRAAQISGKVCGEALTGWFVDPIESLSVTAIGQDFLATWVVNGELFARWVDRSGASPGVLSLKNGVTSAAAVASLGAGTAALVEWTSAPAPGTPEWTILPALGQPTGLPRALVPPNAGAGTNFFGAAVAEGGAFALLHTELGLFRQPFDGGTSEQVATRVTGTPLMARTAVAAHLVASTDATGVSPFLLTGAPGAAPTLPQLLSGYTAEALTPLRAPGTALLVLSDGQGSPSLSFASMAGVGGSAGGLTMPAPVLEARPLQRFPSIVWEGTAWLVAWEEVDASEQTAARAVFARVSPQGEFLTLKLEPRPNGPPLEAPTLLQRPNGSLALLSGPPTARRLFDISVSAGILTVTPGNSESREKPSVLAGDQRTVQWASSPSPATTFDDSARGLWDAGFQAAPEGVAASGRLWVPGLTDAGVVVAELADVATSGPNDGFLNVGLAQAQGPLGVGARVALGELSLLLSWRDPSLATQLGVLSLDGGMRLLGRAPVELREGSGPVGVEAGWFMVGLSQGGLNGALIPASGAPAILDPLESQGVLAFDPRIATGPPGYHAVAWTFFDGSPGNRAGRIRLALYAPSERDAGVEPERDAGVEPDPDAGTSEPPDAGTNPGDGGADPKGGTLTYSACGCQGAEGSLWGAAVLVALALSRRRGRAG